MYGYGPIHEAAELGTSYIVCECYCLSSIGRFLLSFFYFGGRVDSVRFLIRSGADVNSKIYTNETPLHLAVKNRKCHFHRCCNDFKIKND